MRVALVLCLMLAGCGDRRTFDERYATTGNAIEERAQNLDAEINAAEQDNRQKD